MTTPESTPDDARSDTPDETDVPPVAPAYSTPPPEGLPDAETS
jgi:hypothetical protein